MELNQHNRMEEGQEEKESGDHSNRESKNTIREL